MQLKVKLCNTHKKGCEMNISKKSPRILHTLSCEPGFRRFVDDLVLDFIAIRNIINRTKLNKNLLTLERLVLVRGTKLEFRFDSDYQFQLSVISIPLPTLTHTFWCLDSFRLQFTTLIWLHWNSHTLIGIVVFGRKSAIRKSFGVCPGLCCM